MFAFFRLIVVGFVVLSVIYLVLVLAERTRIKRELREDWDREGRPGSLKDYTRRGLKEYEGSLERKVLLAVFILPIIAVSAIIYIVNFM